MEKKPPPFTVLLDANVWIEERLLRSSLGSALLCDRWREGDIGPPGDR